MKQEKELLWDCGWFIELIVVSSDDIGYKSIWIEKCNSQPIQVYMSEKYIDTDANQQANTHTHTRSIFGLHLYYVTSSTVWAMKAAIWEISRKS